ncbi:MAG: AraC family transcriptional regulator [Thermodesulfobacteriota bacterium]
MYLTKLASIQLVLWNMLEKYNQDPAPVFEQVGLNPELMHQPGERYPLDRIAALWEEMEGRINDPCFGLTAATCWHPSHFGTLGYALLVSKSLRVTLERLIRFHRVISDADFGALQEERENNTLTFTLNYKDELHYTRGREDAAIAWIMSVLQVNFQQDLRPLAVHLTHPRPKCEERYFEYFRSAVHFNSPACKIILPLDTAEQPLTGSNEKMAEFADQTMTTYLADLDSNSQVNQIREIIVNNLPSGNVSVEQVAGELGISGRKLQRVLQDRGTTFLSLLNDTRMELAKEFIRDRHIDLTEVAFLLGFAELSTFSRSFKRWTGTSPLQFRKAA